MEREANEFDELFVPFDIRPRPLPPGVKLGLSRFPPPTATTTEGLLCVGGRLTPEYLLDAYRHAIFPWPMWANDPIAWWSPDPRAIFELDGLHVSRRLQRTVRSGKFRVTFDQDFAGVIQACATVDDRTDSTWLTPSMIQAYCRLHELGHAHSVEVHFNGALVGGTYGVSAGGLFAAESMFHHERDASKVALVHLVEHLNERGYRLLDIQQWTPHTGSMGAINISRDEYLRRLSAAIDQPVTFL
ncbi:MAG: leucyl/phenylalanyl-tRNA--protein transferase [Pirellulales bacterium]